MIVNGSDMLDNKILGAKSLQCVSIHLTQSQVQMICQAKMRCMLRRINGSMFTGK